MADAGRAYTILATDVDPDGSKLQLSKDALQTFEIRVHRGGYWYLLWREVRVSEKRALKALKREASLQHGYYEGKN